MTARAMALVLVLAGSACAQARPELDIDATPVHANFSHALPPGSFISVVDLNVPSEAAKEFEKGNRSIAKQDWSKAAESLHKAVALYPAYAAAYNNLGVVYSHLGDRDQEREALQRAVSLNDHLALAYLNLGRMNMEAGNFPDAEILLNKASTLAPNDAVTLILLAYVEWTEQHFEAAVAVCRKAHALRAGHGFTHRVAARVYEREKRISAAIDELQLCLKEEPAAPWAEAVRKELAMLQAIPH